MSIDRISRPAQPAAQPSAPRSPESASAFEVQRASCPEGEAAPAARTALERLRDGEIDRDAYVRAKVEAVLAPLHGLAPSERAFVERTLRDALASDGAWQILIGSCTRFLR